MNFLIKLTNKFAEQHFGTKFAVPYATLFMAALEEKILSKVKKKPSFWFKYTYHIFFVWEHGKKSLKEFSNEIN